MTRTTIATALLAIAAGCSSVELSDDARRSVRTVSFSKEIPTEATYSGSHPRLDPVTRGSPWFATWITAPVGMVLNIIDYSDTQERRSQAFVHWMHELDIHVPAVTRNQFMLAVERSRVFDRVVSNGGDAEFRISVDYGISDGMGVRGSWRPWLTVEGELVDRDGNLLWRSCASVSSSDRRLPEMVDPLRKSKVLSGAYVKAARMVASDLVAHLQGRS